MKSKKIGAKIYLCIVFLFLYLPIFYLIFYSFNSNGNMQQFGHFSLQYYKELFADDRLIQIVLQTFLLAFLSALLATIIGLGGAIFIQNIKRKRNQELFLQFNNILLVSPDVIIGASFLVLFTVLGMKLGFTSVLLSHVAFSIPIVVLMILPKLKELPSSMIEAAYDLGATPWRVFWKIILPYLSSSIIVAYFMAFTYSLDDFAVTFFVTGNGFSTLSVEIYSRARHGISLEINALSTLLFFVSLLLVIGYYFMSKEKETERQGKK